MPNKINDIENDDYSRSRDNSRDPDGGILIQSEFRSTVKGHYKNSPEKISKSRTMSPTEEII